MPARSSARDGLCVELLDLLDQIENDLAYDLDVEGAQRDGAATVINAVCEVIDAHLFKGSSTKRARKRIA